MQAVVFGRYYSTESILHKLDPRVKLVAVVIFAVSLFFTDSLWALFIAGGILAILIGSSHIPFRHIAKGVRGILVLLIFSALCNLFFTKGTVIWRMGIISVTYEGVYNGLVVSFRLILLLFASTLLTLTTTTGELTGGLEQGLWFLTKIKVPVHDIAMMMSIALHFIPILVEEAEKIIKAQKARGADFYERNWIKRGIAMLPVLLPLFAAALRRGNELATAMDARCYGAGKKRTKLNPLQYSMRDYVAYGMILGYGVIFLVVL